MTSEDLRLVVENALGTVPFAPPVSVGYCGALHKAIKVATPDAKVDVFHRHRDLVVEVWLGTAHHRLVVPLA